MPIRVLLIVLSLMLVGGCAQVPKRSVVERPEAVEYPWEVKPARDGSIYQASAGYRPLFEDRRPRMIGDILTVILDEQVSASKNSQSTANRTGAASMTPTGVPDGLEDLIDYGFELEGENAFEGGGGSQANNTFTGTISVMVVGVLPNGNLQVHGEKQIAINQGTEFIRFAGVIDPLSVSGEKTVRSAHVADARIEYVGDGYINEAQHMGWLQRFFLNISPF